MRREFVSIFVGITLLAATALVEGLATSSAMLQAEAQASQVAESTARELEQMLLLHGSAVDGLAAFIESHHRDMVSISASFSDFSASIVDSMDAVRSVDVDLGTSIELLYPLEGNRRAIGLDLFADPERRARLDRSIGTGDTVLEGPISSGVGGDSQCVGRCSPTTARSGDLPQ